MKINIKYEDKLRLENTDFDNVDDALDYLLSMTNKTEHKLRYF